jgi:phosphohistidine swiveling domain-containing protein
VFEVLTASTFASFLAQEECALLKIALETSSAADLRRQRLLEHQQQFFWMQNNYVADRVLDLSFFEMRLQELDMHQANEHLRVLSEQGEEHRRRKDSLISELGLPDDLCVLLTITDDFAAWQDERKKGTFFATHAFTLLLREISQRTGYSLEELVYALPPEMEAIMQKQISSAELRQRLEYCMVLWVGDEYEVITDQVLIKELDWIGTGLVSVGAGVKGFAASRGIARGPVRIIESAQDIGRVQEGDVLVAVMTRPDYLPAMKKAVAFVTDEGGVTCHAAIVAREMRKPCVIGTKSATKILKDGELVEVDADQGVVRKIGG